MATEAAPQPRLDIISDAICPWCYIGKHQLERALPVLAEQGLNFEVHWHAFQLNPDMPEEGRDRAAYRLAKFGTAEKSRELDARIVEAGAAVGLTIRPELMRRTPNTVAAHRVLWLADRRGVQNEVAEALFAAYFTEGEDIGDPATLARVAASGGLPEAETAAFLRTEEGRKDVLAEDAMARQSGINGVPSFTMAGHVLFSGAVPAETMVEAFARAWSILGRSAA
jgi:predicted DsbA family dithiol-disulfide isomerase